LQFEAILLADERVTIDAAWHLNLSMTRLKVPVWNSG
jgi:hypothetical protein